MAVLMTPPFQQFFDDDGNPLVDGKIYTYAAGSTTPKAVYTDASGNTEHENPVPLDSAGRAVVFILGSYKFVVTDANDNPIRTVDNITSFNVTASQNDSYFETLSGNGSQTAFTLSEDLGTDENSILVFVDNGLPDYVANGDFATDTIWTKGSGWSIGSGVATAAGAISTDISQTSAITLVQGQSYVVTYTITRSAGSITPNIGGTAGTARSSSGTYTEAVIAGSSQTIAFNTAGFTGTLDNVSVKPMMSIGRQILAPSQYTLDGDEIVFAVAPKQGTNNILIFAPSLLVGAASAAAALAEQFRDEAETFRNQSEAFRDETEGLRDDTQDIYDQIIGSQFVLYGSSVTNLTIGTGSKIFATQSGKQWILGQRLRAASDDGTKVMEGVVTDYTGTQLTLNVDYTESAGSHADWNISVTGVRGATGASDSSFKNILINGGFSVNQRALTSVADDAYHLDRWYALSQTGNVTISQLTDAENGQPTSLRMTQPDVSAKRIGVAQIVEGKNCKHLRGQSAAFSARVRCSSSQALRYAILAWTGTEDVVVSDVVNNWSSGTFTPGNFFNTSNLSVVATGNVTPGANAWASISGFGAVSASMNNLIVMVWSEGTLAQNATLDLGLCQLEQGVVASYFEYRPITIEQNLCGRYYQSYTSDGSSAKIGLIAAQCYSTVNFILGYQLVPEMRTIPSNISPSAASDFNCFTAAGGNAALTALVLTNATRKSLCLTGTVASGLIAGNSTLFTTNSVNARLGIEGCEL